MKRQKDAGTLDIFSLARAEILDAPTYSPGKPIEEARRELAIEGNIIKLASNENPYGLTDSVRAALVEALDELNRYPDGGSFTAVRALAEYHRVEPSRIFVGSGSNEVIDLLTRAFVSPGDGVVYPHPSFMVYDPICHINYARKIPVPLVNDRLDMDGMAAAIDGKTKLVLICNPNNPSGTYVGRSEVEGFMGLLPDNVLTAFDEAYWDFVTADDYPDTLGTYGDRPNVIILRTFSKLFALAGIRFGYAIAHPDVVTCLHKVRQPFHVNNLAQVAAVAALKDRELYKEKVLIILSERERVEHALLELGCRVPPSQTNFLLVYPPSGDGELVEKMMRKGVIVRGMKPSGYDPQVFRVTIGTPEENDLFLRVLQETLAA